MYVYTHIRNCTNMYREFHGYCVCIYLYIHMIMLYYAITSYMNYCIDHVSRTVMALQWPRSTSSSSFRWDRSGTARWNLWVVGISPGFHDTKMPGFQAEPQSEHFSQSENGDFMD